MTAVDDGLSAARSSLAEAQRTGRGVEAAARQLDALERAAEVLDLPIAEVSAMPHRHARPQEGPPAELSLLTPSERAELDARWAP